MKLQDFDRFETARSALKQTFDVDFDPSNLDKIATRSMLVKVKNLMAEAKQSKEFYSNPQSPAYLKLLFMAESLSSHYRKFTDVEIVTENKQVEQAEVTLAAQEMVDSVQKMVEQVNDMLVKELPALTDAIQTQLDAAKSETFNTTVSQSLTTLNQTLSQTRQSLQDALNQLTGDAGSAFSGDEKAVTDITTTSAPLPGGGEMQDTEISAELPALDEPEDTGPVGRAKRV